MDDLNREVTKLCNGELHNLYLYIKERNLKEPHQISVFCTLVAPCTAGFVKALSTPLAESKRRLCYAHVTVSRFYRTTACISDLETSNSLSALALTSHKGESI